MAICKDVLDEGPIIYKNLSKLRSSKPLGERRPSELLAREPRKCQQLICEGRVKQVHA